MNLQRIPFYCALAAMPMAVAPAVSAQMLIDDFSGPNQAVANQGLVLSNEVDHGAVLGGERDLTMAFGGSSGVLGTTGVVSDGVFSFANSPASQGALGIIYDGNDNSSGLNTGGLGGLDLSDGGAADAFAFTLLFADFEVEYSVGFWDTSSDQASFTGTLPSGLTGGGSVEIIVPFASLVGTADITDVGAIVLAFEAQELAADITIDNFRTVPEPTSIALLMAGGALLARRRRRD